MENPSEPINDESDKEAQETVKTIRNKVKRSFLDTSRRVLLAGIGAITLAQDEIEDFVDGLVERGEIAEKDGRKMFLEIMDYRKKTSKDTEAKMRKQVEVILNRLNVPTKADIDMLCEKIAYLTKKVDELHK